MNRLQKTLWFTFFCLFIYNSAYSQVIIDNGISHYLPLSKGNGWKALRFSSITNPSQGSVTLTGMSVSDSMVFGKYTYYKYNQLWLRYEGETDRIYCKDTTNNEYLYIDFMVPDNITYSSYLGIITAKSKQIKIGDDIYTAKGYYLLTSSSGNTTHIECYFVKNFGMIYEYRYGSYIMANYFNIETKTIEFHSTNQNMAHSYYTSAKPSIELQKAAILQNSNLNIKSLINHPYSFLTYYTVPGYFVRNGLSFIRSANVEYFYFNGIDTLNFTSINMVMDNEINFSGNISINYPLFRLGYKLYYRIKAVDKSFLYHTVYLPNDGYNLFNNNLTTNPLYNYYPLNNTNKYIYKVEEVDNNGTVINRQKNKYVYFINDTTLSGIKYYRYYCNNNLQLERYDSVSSYVFTPSINNSGTVYEIPTHFLWGRSADTSTILVNGTLNKYTCGTLKFKNLFGIDTVYYKTYTNTTTSEFFNLAYNFGKIESIYFENNKRFKETLIAAKINNIIYGDSLLFVGINETKEDNSDIKFNLCQNYPNPFNPVTTIDFSIPNSGLVTLKIYDILGKEVATLVNMYLQAGTYSKTWDVNNLPSGVYFYKLSYNNLIKTKKMIYLK
ncbi:MAG TPA: T9SS type A sorting domain-containing protein [Melioribacteraceae bacterium]|nr:T9SS type A sorting domain-containing protein [Melioribacteraceae bacterium]